MCQPHSLNQQTRLCLRTTRASSSRQPQGMAGAAAVRNAQGVRCCSVLNARKQPERPETGTTSTVEEGTSWQLTPHAYTPYVRRQVQPLPASTPVHREEQPPCAKSLTSSHHAHHLQVIINQQSFNQECAITSSNHDAPRPQLSKPNWRRTQLLIIHGDCLKRGSQQASSWHLSRTTCCASNAQAVLLKK
jgi:hypothetical protein